MKILIYIKKSDLKPVGGPAGYLYNLYKGLKEIKNNDIYFLNEDKNKSSNLKAIVRSIIPSKLWYKLRLIKYVYNTINSDGKEYKGTFNNFDAIHFHTTADLYKNRKLLKKYNGKIILTSHCPEAPYLETKDLLLNENIPSFLVSKIIGKLKKIDIYSFKNATNIIFPCKEAMEPYVNTFKYFRDKYNKLMVKISFLPSGTISRQKIYPDKYIVNNKKFKVCYIGRHNRIKGYDLLLKAAKKMSKLDNDVQFIIAGRLGPIYPDRTLKNWKELGWTDKPLNVEASCDLFVLPNRETYFDLALIEAISVPSIVLISATGGNKYFKRFKTKAINFFRNKDVNDLVNKILFIKNHDNIPSLRKENRKIYNDNFTTRVFAKNYIKVIRNIVEG